MLLRIHLHKEQRGPERRKWGKEQQRSAGSSGRSSREDWWNHLGINEIKSLKTVPETHPEVSRLGRRGVVVGSVISGKDGKLGSSVAGHTLDRHLSHTESSHSHRHGFHWVFASFTAKEIRYLFLSSNKRLIMEFHLYFSNNVTPHL